MKNFIYVVFISFVILITGGCGDKENKQDTKTVVTDQQNTSIVDQKKAGQCVEEKIAIFERTHGPVDSIRMDVLREWHQECGFNPDLADSASESASFDDDGKNNTVVASTTTTTAAPVRSAKPPKLEFSHTSNIKFTATEDQQTITNVIVNRGNCKVTVYKDHVDARYGNTGFKSNYARDVNVLKFGEYILYPIGCLHSQVLEVQATVNGTVHTWTTSN